MDEKFERASAWLKKVYGSEPVPDFEVNESTVDFLYNLAECIESRERHAALQIEDMKQKAEDYEATTKYLQGLGEILAISPDSLSSKGTSYLNSLVKSAMVLKTKDTSLASFFCAINNMTSELYAIESEIKEKAQELKSMREELTAVLLLEKQVKKDLKNSEAQLEAEELEANNQSLQMEFLKTKSQDLSVNIQTAEDKLAAVGFDQSLTHESLVDLSKKVAKKRAETEPLKKKMEIYQDLPLSVPLIKVKIEEANQELKTLEEQLSKEVENMTPEMLPSRK